jgi:hypothetical protein
MINRLWLRNNRELLNRDKISSRMYYYTRNSLYFSVSCYFICFFYLVLALKNSISLKAIKKKKQSRYRPLGIQSQTSLSTTIKQKLIKQLSFLRSVHLLLRAISRFDIPLDLSAGISVDFFSYQLWSNAIKPKFAEFGWPKQTKKKGYRLAIWTVLAANISTAAIY